MNTEKFLEKLDANNTSVTKEIAARLMRIIEKGLKKERLRIDFMVIKFLIIDYTTDDERKIWLNSCDLGRGKFDWASDLKIVRRYYIVIVTTL